VDFSQGKVNMTLASWLQRSHADAVIDFAAHTTGVSHTAYHWARQPAEIAPFLLSI